LAYVHLNRGEVDKAICDARKAVELAPELAGPHGTLGEAYFWKENYYEAAAELGRAIGLNSHDYGSHNRLGDVHYMKENYEVAKIEYEQALKLAESGNDVISMAEASTSLGYMALKQHKWDVADSRFNQALHWNPKSDYVHFCRGLLLFTLKEPEKAKADWNKALALCNGTSPLKRMERAIYKVALGLPVGVDEMSSIIKEHPPIGMMDAALDDTNLLLAFKIYPAESEKVRDMLAEAIKEALKQPARGK
jgi:tetratricopeptide (TPR) repeat protein